MESGAGLRQFYDHSLEVLAANTFHTFILHVITEKKASIPKERKFERSKEECEMDARFEVENRAGGKVVSTVESKRVFCEAHIHFCSLLEGPRTRQISFQEFQREFLHFLGRSAEPIGLLLLPRRKPRDYQRLHFPTNRNLAGIPPPVSVNPICASA